MDGMWDKKQKQDQTFESAGIDKGEESQVNVVDQTFWTRSEKKTSWN